MERSQNPGFSGAVAWRVMLGGAVGAGGFIGALVLAGWALNVDALGSRMGGLSPGTSGTAVAWLVAAAVFWLTVVLTVALVMPAARARSDEQRLSAEANRLKSEFLASMSHELRTPLTAIIGFTELVHDGEAGPVTEKQREYLDYALTSSRQMLQLVNDLLDLARAESGQLEFLPEPVDAATTVRQALAPLLRLAENKRIKVEVETDSSLGDIVIDPRRLRQILYNYLSNALKFTPAEGRVTVRLRSEGRHYFRLEVEDSGIGIAAEDLGGLFTNFHQVDGSLAKLHQGTGLGLALTKRLVEAQQGRVGVESAAGKGSLFYAILPRVVQSAEPSSR